MFQAILHQKIEFPESFSEEAKSLLEGLLQRDPNKRFSSASEIKDHDFFAEIDWDKIYNKEYMPPFRPKLDG